MIRLEQSKEMEAAEKAKLEEEIRHKQEEVQKIQEEVSVKDEETRRLQVSDTVESRYLEDELKIILVFLSSSFSRNFTISVLPYFNAQYLE